MTLEICELQPAQEHIWDRFVCDCTDAGVYHLSGWKHVLNKTYGHETRYFMATDGHAVQAILPLFIVRSRVFGTQVSSLPGGIYARNATVGQAVLEEAITVAEDLDADNLLISQGKRVWDGDFVTIHRHCSQTRLLPGDPEDLWSSLRSTVRNRVRRARKAGVLTIWGGAEQIDTFYPIFSHNLRDLGTPVFGKDLLCNLMAEFPEQTRILIAKQGNLPIGGMLLFLFKDMVYNPWLASIRKHFDACPNDLLYWEALRWACQEGFRRFDFGRSQWDTGTFRFKRKWGAEAYPLYNQYYLRRGIAIPDYHLKAERVLLYRLINGIWRRLPVGLASLVGPHLRKNLYPL